MICPTSRSLSNQAALPYRLDPSSLETIGLETLGGALSPGVPVDMGSEFMHSAFGAFQQLTHKSNAALPRELVGGGGDACTAHPHVDSNTGRLCLFTYKMRTTGGCAWLVLVVLSGEGPMAEGAAW